MVRLLFSLISLTLLTACHERQVVKQFRNIPARQAGIDFVNSLQDEPDFNIVEYLYYYNGGGVAIGDLNNDNLPDICFTGNQRPNEVYLNKGDFRFELMDQALLDGEEAWSTGVTMADVNGDGFLDIYICQVGEYKVYSGGRNLLYLNNGDLTFTEAAADHGVDFSGFSTQAVFLDYDLDGDLDMYLVNHAVHTPRSFASSDGRLAPDALSGDRLFKNLLIETGTLKFDDVTVEAGIYSSLLGYGLGVATADINGDEWPDIYVSNDFHENDYLYINQQNGTFKEEAQSRLAHMSRFSMGSDIADINGDSQMDIFTLDMLPADPSILMQSGGEDSEEVYSIKIQQGYHHQYSRNTMQINQGGQFVDLALLTDTYATDWSWSVLIEDYDLNGLNDLFITNGIYRRPNDLDYINFLSNAASSELAQLTDDEKERALIKKMPTMKLANYMFRNGGDTSFVNVAEAWGIDEPSYSNGAAYGDLDNDGDLDLVINNINGSPFLHQNQNLQGNHFAKVRLAGEPGNVWGIGAKVTLYQADRRQTKTLSTTRGFLSSSAPTLIFGLGATTDVDSVKVAWGRGRQQTFYAIAADTMNVLTFQPTEALNIDLKEKSTIRELPFTHHENNYDDFDVEPLMPHRLSKLGPALAIGDVDQDGWDDVFIGGGKNQAPALLFQNSKGEFENIPGSLAKDFPYEDVAAHFFDADGDEDLDLVVLSGGNEFTPQRFLYRHRMFENLGHRQYARRNGWLPNISSNGSVASSADYDGDGDLDLFIGSSSIPGSYGMSPTSYLLENDGTGRFTDITQSKAPFLSQLGMVRDAQWYDYQGDGDLDLVVVGLWMPVTHIVNEDGKFVLSEIKDSDGWWNTVAVADVDKDGRSDLIAGNLGLNSKLKASAEEPLTLYIDDFDGNGRIDALLFHYWNHAFIPFHTRDEIASQIPEIKKRFLSYKEFASVRTLQDLLPRVNSAEVLTKTCVQLQSSIYLQKKDGFVWTPLPKSMQTTPLNDLIVIKENGATTFLGVGNFLDSNVLQGRYVGKVILGATKTEKAWTEIDIQPRLPNAAMFSGLAVITTADAQGAFILSRNNGPAVLLDAGIISSSK